MARTAGELSSDELRSYRPWETLRGYRDSSEVKARWDRAWHTARGAARLLKERYGASRVVVFGSLAHRDWFTPWSDIDLAVWDVPVEKFYRAVGAVMDLGVEAGFSIDVVDPRECRAKLVHNIQTEGIEL